MILIVRMIMFGVVGVMIKKLIIAMIIVYTEIISMIIDSNLKIGICIMINMDKMSMTGIYGEIRNLDFITTPTKIKTLLNDDHFKNILMFFYNTLK